MLVETPLNLWSFVPFLHACRDARPRVDWRRDLFYERAGINRRAGALTNRATAFRQEARGVDCDALDEAGREALVNGLLHEASIMPVTVLSDTNIPLALWKTPIDTTDVGNTLLSDADDFH